MEREENCFSKEEYIIPKLFVYRDVLIGSCNSSDVEVSEHALAVTLECNERFCANVQAAATACSMHIRWRVVIIHLTPPTW